MKNFVIKLRQNLCLDKMGFIKGIRHNFVLSFVLTLRLLQVKLESLLKYSIACIYLLTFVMPTKTRPTDQRTDANLYPPKRQLTKASEPSFDLVGGAQGQI